MRCDEVIRGRSAPGGDLDRSALASHLAACPRCASWSAQADALDRLWAATRPDDPPAEVFDAIWANVREAAAEPVVLPFVAAPAWKRWALILAAGAQAAAILVAAFYALNRPVPTVAAVGDLRVEEGTTLIVTLDGGRGATPNVEVRPHRGGSDTDMVAVDLDVLNFMESL